MKTVAEVIDLLKQHPPTAEVTLSGDWDAKGVMYVEDEIVWYDNEY